MQVAAAEVFGGHDFAGRGLHQRWTAEEDRALVADDHGLVAHRGHVRASRGARAEHGGDLRNAVGAELGLVVEDAAEMLTVGEDFVLPRQERTARVDQVDTRQPILPGDLLRPQMLLDRDRVVRTAFHGGVVGHDHAFAPGDPSDAGDHSRAGALVVVHAVGGEGRHFEQRAAGVEQPVHALPRQQLAPTDVALAGPGGPAERGGGHLLPQLRDERQMLVAAGLEHCCHRYCPFRLS